MLVTIVEQGLLLMNSLIEDNELLKISTKTVAVGIYIYMYIYIPMHTYVCVFVYIYTETLYLVNNM